MRRQNLLLVAYHFPPRGGSGVQRAAKLARYLPRCGWRVHVLTAGHDHHVLVDQTLLEEFGEDVIVHRVPGWEPGALAARIAGLAPKFWRKRVDRIDDEQVSRTIEDRIYWRLDRLCSHLNLPEVETLWRRSAIAAARRIIARHGIDAVVTTSPPHSTQLVGAALRSEVGIPWIADLRDPIVDNFAIESEPAGVLRWRRDVEQTVCADADRVVVTCPELRDRLIERYGVLEASKIGVVLNGFDPTDAPTAPVRETRGNVFTLSYVGSFYRAQSIEPLLSAARRFLEARPDARGRFEVRVAGSIAARQRLLVRASDSAFLRELGYVPHGEAIAEMSRADALFLMTPHNNGGRFCIPAKVFEYLGFGGHVIALVHRGTALEGMLRAAGDVSLVFHDRADELTHSLLHTYDAWAAGGRSARREPAALYPYHRETQAALYSEILQSVVAPASPRVRQPPAASHVGIKCHSCGISNDARVVEAAP